MSVRRALAFSFLDRYSSLLISIVSSMFIARLLTPGEIGVFSVTMVLLTFTTSLRDLGAGQYLLQEKELTADRIRATWAVLLMVGVFFSFIVLAAAWPLSRFYGDARMFDIMLVVALNFAVNPFGSLTYAWLMREMRFDALATMRASSALAGAAVAISMAWAGYGPISLASGSLASTMANAAMAIRFRPAHFPWMPGLKEIRRVVSFGSRISGITIVNNVSWGAPELLLGKMIDLTAAGLFSRANGLASMFQRLILDGTQAVVLPMFAKESREHGNINASLIQAMAYITALGWAFFSGLALLAHPAMRLLYGPQWDSAVELTRLISVALAIALPAALCPAALTAVGAVNRLLRLSVITALVYVPLMAVGVHFGLYQAGLACVGTQVIMVSIWVFYTHQRLHFEWWTLFSALSKSAVVAAITSLAPLAAVLIFGWTPDQIFGPLALALVGGPVLFIGAVLGTAHPIKAEVMKLQARFYSR